MDRYIPIRKANTLDDVYGAVMTQPLSIEDMDEFYCDTDAVRGNIHARGNLARLIRNNAKVGKNAHILFVGYRGCGKSTELNHLQKDLKDKFFVLNYSVMTELDPQSINYIELFIVTMEKLFTLAVSENIVLEPSFIDKITHWQKTDEIEEIKEKYIGGEVEIGTEGKFGIPYLQQLFINLKGAAKVSKSFKETIKENIEPRLSQLIALCNELISGIRQELLSRGYTDLLIFIEDLDKIPIDRAISIFYNYANQLTQLQCTVVYTFPVTLYHNTKFGSIRNYFGSIVELPMVKVSLKDGTKYTEGIATLKKIVDTRVNESLFQTEDLTERFIASCGGVLRDLFTMISNAADFAATEGLPVIQEQHFTFAFNKLKREYDATVADYTSESNTVYKAKQMYEALRDLALDTDKQPDNEEIMLLLRQNLCVLSYNGEGWCDVHPAMKAVLKDRKYLQ